MKKFRYVCYTLSIAFCVFIIIFAFGGNSSMQEKMSKTFGTDNCSNYVSFEHRGFGHTNNVITIDDFILVNKTTRTLKNVTLFCYAGLGSTVYKIAELKPNEKLQMEIEIENFGSISNLYQGSSKIHFSAEGQVE